jgi:hypothetical protein
VNRINKQRFIATIIIVLLLVFTFSSSAAASGTIFSILYDFYKGFKHVGTLDHEHSFSSAEGEIKFFAEGQGLVGGSHNARARDTNTYSKLNSSETYTGYTDRIARSDQYIKLTSSYGLSRGYKGFSGVMPNTNEIGTISQDISSKSEAGKGHYYKHSNNVKNTDGLTVMRSTAGESVTDIEVDGYTEYREVVIIESGGVRTGWWDMN